MEDRLKPEMEKDSIDLFLMDLERCVIEIEVLKEVLKNISMGGIPYRLGEFETRDVHEFAAEVLKILR